MMNDDNMGNKKSTNSTESETKDKFTPVHMFRFLEPFQENSTNGLCLNNIYLPEEIIEDILSYVPSKDLLGLTLVCKKWCNIIKSDSFWMSIYNRCYPGKVKKLPWYVFYCYFATKNFENLLKNGNGQEQYKYWSILQNGGDKFKIENPPAGSDPLPMGIPEFNGHTSCFATSFENCIKRQLISLEDKRLLRYILYKFMPNIYVSEWVAGRFDCGCFYKLGIKILGSEPVDNGTALYLDGDSPVPTLDVSKNLVIEQWQGKAWGKVDFLVEKYPNTIDTIIFIHQGRDTQYWKGHYGSKMAGGVVKIMFDSIQPLGEIEEAEIKDSNQNIDLDT